MITWSSEVPGYNTLCQQEVPKEKGVDKEQGSVHKDTLDTLSSGTLKSLYLQALPCIKK